MLGQHRIRSNNSKTTLSQCLLFPGDTCTRLWSNVGLMLGPFRWCQPYYKSVLVNQLYIVLTAWVTIIWRNMIQLNIDLLLAHRLRRWANIRPTSAQRPMFARIGLLGLDNRYSIPRYNVYIEYHTRGSTIILIYAGNAVNFLEII